MSNHVPASPLNHLPGQCTALEVGVEWSKERLASQILPILINISLGRLWSGGVSGSSTFATKELKKDAGAFQYYNITVTVRMTGPGVGVWATVHNICLSGPCYHCKGFAMANDWMSHLSMSHLSPSQRLVWGPTQTWNLWVCQCDSVGKQCIVFCLSATTKIRRPARVVYVPTRLVSRVRVVFLQNLIMDFSLGAPCQSMMQFIAIFC